MQVKESKTSFHFWMSMTKSVIRIIGCWFLLHQDFTSSALLLVFAEVIGMLEEI